MKRNKITQKLFSFLFLEGIDTEVLLEIGQCAQLTCNGDARYTHTHRYGLRQVAIALLILMGFLVVFHYHLNMSRNFLNRFRILIAIQLMSF